MPTRSGTRTGRRGKPNVREAAILPATKGGAGGQCPLWAPGAGGERKQCDGHGAQLAQYWQMTVTAVTVVFTFHCVSVVEVPFT
ncbi:hypothetical protein [Mangrovibacter phragmitis]|uniref:hypothetical protein n=1 Tax=Mangrovibacter phragmitis TaxID=1691903 RepID=UPI0012E9478C|nr:hypothetical protein [Mangrovibacter phragmitis]